MLHPGSGISHPVETPTWRTRRIREREKKKTGSRQCLGTWGILERRDKTERESERAQGKPSGWECCEESRSGKAKKSACFFVHVCVLNASCAGSGPGLKKGGLCSTMGASSNKVRKDGGCVWVWPAGLVPWRVGDGSLDQQKLCKNISYWSVSDQVTLIEETVDGLGWKSDPAPAEFVKNIFNILSKLWIYNVFVSSLSSRHIFFVRFSLDQRNFYSLSFDSFKLLFFQPFCLNVWQIFMFFLWGFCVGALAACSLFTRQQSGVTRWFSEIK